jgi:hypothetical protein
MVSKEFYYKYRKKEEGNNQIIIVSRVGGEKSIVKAIVDIGDAIRVDGEKSIVTLLRHLKLK